MARPVIRLHPGKHKRIAQGHPWVYSNEIVMDGAAKALPPGAIVAFKAHDGTFLGWGSFNPKTLIAGRVFDRTPLGQPDFAWLTGRLEAALSIRDALIGTPYYRLVHAEADGLPGLIVDRFGDYLSLEINTAGMEALQPVLLDALESLLSPKGIIVHADTSARAMEGLVSHVSVVRGAIPQGPVPVLENGLTYYADLQGGQKTGWYFDQRDNHALMARFAQKASVLDLYCHAGGFGLLATARGAARVVGVDSSQSALEMAHRAAKEADLLGRCTFCKADVFEELEKRFGARDVFDVVIADPPPFVKSRKDLAAGARGYRKLARLSAQVTAPGGVLYIASCSHNMGLDDLAVEVARGLAEAGRMGRTLFTTFAAPDHPVLPALPESAYLKGFVIQLD